MYICSLFITHTKATELIQPCEGAFHNPTPTSQPTAMPYVAHCKQGKDAPVTHSVTDVLRVISPVCQHAVRTAARPSTKPLERRNPVEQCQSLCGIVAVRSRRRNGQRNTTPVADQVALAATFSAIRRIRSCLLPPKTARTEQLSTTARDQSIWFSRESQFSNAK
jgi:hypothetical protein